MRRVEFADAPPAGVDAPGAGAVDLTALLLDPAKPSSPRLEAIAAVEPPVETRARDAAFAVESWVRTQPIQFAGATVDDATAAAGRETAQRPGSDAPRTGAVGLGARSVTPESPAPTRRDADPPADRSAQNAAPRPASSYLYTALTSLLGGSLVWTWGRRRAESGCVERPPRSRWRPVLRD